MSMHTRKNRKPAALETRGFGRRIERVSGDYDGGGIGGAAAGLGDAAGEGGREADEGGQEAGDVFFD